jgi:hypothetical protein
MKFKKHLQNPNISLESTACASSPAQRTHHSCHSAVRSFHLSASGSRLSMRLLNVVMQRLDGMLRGASRSARPPARQATPWPSQHRRACQNKISNGILRVAKSFSPHEADEPRRRESRDHTPSCCCTQSCCCRAMCAA